MSDIAEVKILGETHYLPLPQMPRFMDVYWFLAALRGLDNIDAVLVTGDATYALDGDKLAVYIKDDDLRRVAIEKQQARKLRDIK